MAGPMTQTADLIYETSMSIDQGRRDRQEDAVVSDFQAGFPCGFVVLADGMGGHAAGDVASKIVVTEVFSELKLQSGDPDLLEPQIGDILRRAAECANECVGLYASTRANVAGMGATLVASVFIEDRLYWVSVGDSPLYLFRDGVLTRLNENHALESQIDFLVNNGIMGYEEALNYPDPSCLTSVLIGDDIPQMDCRSMPLRIRHDDILIVASDGLQFLDDAQIEGILRFSRKRSADDISAALMREIHKLDDPDQDNVSFCVIKAVQEGAKMSEPPAEAVTHSSTHQAGNKTITILAKVSRSGAGTA